MSLIELKTLAKGSLFHYEGSIKEGIEITYGRLGNKKNVPHEILETLLKNFSNKTVLIDATRTIENLHEGSLGHWLNNNIDGPVITSYIASILVHEGYAELYNKELKFRSYQ